MRQEQLKPIVEAAQSGDESAFAELVRSFQDFAVASAYAILSDLALAEDAAQEAFVEVHKRLGTLQQSGAFVPWFRTVIYKHCDRMTRRRQHPMADLETAAEIATTAPSPHETFESKTGRLMVRAAISELPEPERVVVLLHYIGNESLEDVAEYLGITSNAVKTRLYSARNKMRTHLADSLQQSLEASRPSRNSLFARRVLNVTFPLQVYTVLENRGIRAHGSTVGQRRMRVPQNDLWFVEPRKTIASHDWDRLFDLMEQMRIPGLSLPGQASDEILKRVGKLHHLRYLNLSDSRAVTSDGVRRLVQLTELEHLDLSGTSVTDFGLGVLRYLPSLRVFELRHHDGVSDEGLAQLVHCRGLERVNVMGTRSGDRTIRALSGKAHLRELYAGNAVTDDGLAGLKELPMFQRRHFVRDQWSLLSFESHTNYLFLNLVAPFTNAGVQALSALEGLSAINLFGTAGHSAFDPSGSSVTASSLESLSRLPSLQWLGCCSQLCTDQALSLISRLPGLRFLMCQDAVAGDDGFASLHNSESLEFIWGRRCHGLTGKGFQALADLPRLRGLSVSLRNVDDLSLSALQDFPALREFMPIDITDHGFRHISACTRLEAIYCMYCPTVTDDATQFLSGLGQLQTYKAWSSQITDRSLAMLSEIQTIKKLLFYKCSALSDQGITLLANLPKLEQLNLEHLSGVTEDVVLSFPGRVDVNIRA